MSFIIHDPPDEIISVKPLYQHETLFKVEVRRVRVRRRGKLFDEIWHVRLSDGKTIFVSSEEVK